ncbi:MAG TPA: ankyrin repeat domain-containing protein [Coxiellaceae bacterium]|nr:ankyrin repeat domain-containing protein [Coxiellaceae bacterium]
MRSLRLFQKAGLGLNAPKLNYFSSLSGPTTFHRIAKIIESGNFADIKSAIDQIDLSSAEYCDLLHIAVATMTFNPKNTRSLEYILSKKVDINKKFSKVVGFSPTPLLIAAMRGCSTTLELLLSHGADSNVACNTDNDPFHRKIVALHQAAELGNEKMVALLIKHHAVIDSRSAAGETPLLHACFKGHLKVMHLLLDHEADPYAYSTYGRLSESGDTPMDFIQLNKTLLEGYNSRRIVPAFLN